MADLENNHQTAAAAEQEAEPQAPSIDSLLLEEMAKTGVLFGRSKSRTDPRMKVYIEAVRNGVEIFDAAGVLKGIEQAADFLAVTAKNNGLILLVGTQPAAKAVIKSMAEKFEFPRVTERWLGGTLTNFQTLSQRINYYMNLKADQAAGKLEKYTKKERTQFDKEIKRLTTLFGGLEKLSKIPDALLIVDAREHETAVREAKRLRVPIVALLSSNNNPDGINYPIPCNSSARLSIEWILKKLEEGLEKGVKERPAK